MIKIGELSKRSGLSRSTLLYYSKIKLFEPSYVNDAGYRFYTEEDERILEKIILYKKAGLSLEKIKDVLNSTSNPALYQRLKELDNELQNIRTQQRMIISMIDSNINDDTVSFITSETFTNILKSSGMNEDNMLEFHVGLELASPKEHLNFLRFFGLSDQECDEVAIQARAEIEQSYNK